MLLIRMILLILGITMFINMSESETLLIGIGKLVVGALFIFLGAFGTKSDR